VHTCDHIITPAKKARVWNISFSSSRPTNTRKLPDFCSYRELYGDNTTTEMSPLTLQQSTNLPKPRQYCIEQNCGVQKYSNKFMNKIEVAES